MKTTIIAEVGVNHNGSVEIAKRLIEECSSAGANIIKFQTFVAERIVSKNAPKAEYQKSDNSSSTQFDMLKKLELSEEDHIQLAEHCEKNNVEFLSTGFDEIDLEMLLRIGIKRVKVPSGEITNLPLLRMVAECGLPTLLSTGMATLDEIEEAVGSMTLAGLPKRSLTILHCTSSYPAPIDTLNLNAMLSIGRHFDTPFGYSDHSQGILASLVAATLGATVIEKHVTLDRAMPGPDHAASIEPDTFRELVKAIRQKELMMGSSIKSPSKEEIANAKVSRKSIVASKDIPRGKKLEKNDLAVMRPADGISPMRWDEVLGTTAIRQFKKGEKNRD